MHISKPDDLKPRQLTRQVMQQDGQGCSVCRDPANMLLCIMASICGAHRISKLCLIHMLLLQQLCTTLLDQVCGVQMHLALLFKAYYFLFQLGTPF